LIEGRRRSRTRVSRRSLISRIRHSSAPLSRNRLSWLISYPTLRLVSLDVLLLSPLALRKTAQNPTAVMADLACMLLANITQFPTTATALCKVTIPLLALPSPSIPPNSITPYYPPLSRSGSAVPKVPYPKTSPVAVSALAVLVDAFVRAAEIPVSQRGEGGDRDAKAEDEMPKTTKGDPARKGDLHFLASVFVNVSGVRWAAPTSSSSLQPDSLSSSYLQTPAGREFFFTPIPIDPLSLSPSLEYPLAKLIAFTEHPSNIRRKGVASTLRFVIARTYTFSPIQPSLNVL
jgi:hypothetical protein